MPEGKLLDDVLRIINYCRDSGAKIALDTSGKPLKRIVHTGNIWLEKANVQELRELLGKRVKDEPASLVRAGQKLLDKIEILLISRGQKGCIAVTNCFKLTCTGNFKIKPVCRSRTGNPVFVDHGNCYKTDVFSISGNFFSVSR